MIRYIRFNFTSIVLSLLVLIIFSGCSSDESRPRGAVVSTAVSIPPLEYLAKQVGGDRVSVMVLLKPGQSPATYEPTPRQMSELAEADLFFAVGVPYEKGLVPRLESSMPDLRIVRAQQNIEFLPAVSGEHIVDVSDAHDHGEHDPHIWLDPRLAAQIAEVMRDELIRLDPEHAEEYRNNFTVLNQQLDSLFHELREILLAYEERYFAAYHPAWGYYARAFGLNQIEISISGKVPGPREIARLVKQTDEYRLNGLIVQPQFKSGTTDAIAEAMGVDVVELDPLSPDYEANLRYITKRMAGLVEGL